jgi:hypothetical protein
MTRAAAVLAAALCLALPAAAAAKEAVALRICGPDGCVDRTAQLRRAGQLQAALNAQPAAEPAAPGGPWVELRVGIGERPGGKVYGHATIRFLPGLGLMCGEDGFWSLPSHATIAALRRAARGVERYPARALHLPPATTPTPAPAPRRRPPVRDAGLSPALPGAGAAALAAAVLLLRRRRRV